MLWSKDLRQEGSNVWQKEAIYVFWLSSQLSGGMHIRLVDNALSLNSQICSGGLMFLQKLVGRNPERTHW